MSLHPVPVVLPGVVLPAQAEHNRTKRKMSRLPVESSVLASALYLPERCRLEVEFRSGLFYHYFDVPPQTYGELLKADSKGRYFNANIRNRFLCKQMASPLQTGHAGS
jgi:hypothetical protein